MALIQEQQMQQLNPQDDQDQEDEMMALDSILNDCCYDADQQHQEQRQQVFFHSRMGDEQQKTRTGTLLVQVEVQKDHNNGTGVRIVAQVCRTDPEAEK